MAHPRQAVVLHTVYNAAAGRQPVFGPGRFLPLPDTGTSSYTVKMPNELQSSREFRAIAVLGAALLAVSCVACGKDTTSARAAGPGKGQEPRPVRGRRSGGGAASAHGDRHRDARRRRRGRRGVQGRRPRERNCGRSGEPGAKGQVLARLDPTDFRLRVEQAEAALRQVRAGLGLPRDGSVESVDPRRPRWCARPGRCSRRRA